MAFHAEGNNSFLWIDFFRLAGKEDGYYFRKPYLKMGVLKQGLFVSLDQGLSLGTREIYVERKVLKSLLFLESICFLTKEKRRRLSRQGKGNIDK